METPTYHRDARSEAAAMPTIPGYDVSALIGRGGMGRVYRARQLALGRMVAVKVLAHEAEERLSARFREEVRAVARLQHPNIAALFETGIADGRPYFSQELLEGGSLSQKWGGLPQEPKDVALLMEVVTRAIEYSHQSGILHRDLKPSNILLAADGTPKVTDFGLAKEVQGDSGDRTSNLSPLTITGEIVGTPAYMPPEQASGVVAGIGPTTDVYSLGAVIYEGLTGRPPFQAAEPLQALMMVLTMDPVAPRTLQPKIPRDLETICLKCLHKSPKKRYPTAAALADDLRRFLQGETILARPVGVVERTVKWAKRRKAAAALAALSVVSVVAIVAFGILEVVNAAKVREANAALAAKNEELESLNRDLVAAKAETDKLLTFSLEAFDESHFDLSERLASVPQADRIRLDLLDNAGKTLDKIYELKPQAGVREYLIDGYNRLGNINNQLDRLDRAETCHRRSLEMATLQRNEQPNVLEHRTGQLLAMTQLSQTLMRLGNPDAGKLQEEFRNEAAALLELHPSNAEVLRLNVMTAMSELNRIIQSQADDEDYLGALERQVSLQRRLLSAAPTNGKYRANFIDMSLSLTDAYSTEQRFLEAVRTLDSARVELETLRKSPEADTRRLDASFLGSRGQIARFQAKYDDCDADFRKALEINRSVLGDFPERGTAVMRVANSWSALALNSVDRKRFDDADKELSEAEALVKKLVEVSPQDRGYKNQLANYAKTRGYIALARSEAATGVKP